MNMSKKIIPTTTISLNSQDLSGVMASPRRPRNGHNHSFISDYESDSHYRSDMAGPPPVARTNEELNLSVLSRHRPDTIAIVYVVPYVVVYIFSPESLSWEKSGMEGSTFLCGLSASLEYDYRCAVVVLNRRGLENLNIELTSDESVDITDEYLIVKNERAGQTKIYGLWVFREPPPSSTSHHPEAFAAKVQECIRRVEKSKKVPDPKPPDSDEMQEISVPMGRQISLRELFGQQRQEDDTWSVRSHSPSHRNSITHSTAVSVVGPVQVVSQFAVSSVIDVLKAASPQSSNPISSLQSQPSQRNDQQQRLLELFRRAKEQART